MRTFILLLLTAFITTTTGCLSVGYKEYRYKFNPDGTGSGSVRFINIVSSTSESEDDSTTGSVDELSDALAGAFTAMADSLDMPSEPATNPLDEDFASLISTYIEGTSWEDEHPKLNITGKRFWAENGQLIGEITFTFNDIGSAGFYRDLSCQCSPYIHYLNIGLLEDETYHTGNGTYLGETAQMPVVLFNPYLPEFKITTKIAGDNAGISLLPQWQAWQESKR